MSRPQLPTYISIRNMKLMIEVYVNNLKTDHFVRATIKAIIDVSFKICKGTTFGAKNYFRPLRVPCIERHLRIRVQLTPWPTCCGI